MILRFIRFDSPKSCQSNDSGSFYDVALRGIISLQKYRCRVALPFESPSIQLSDFLNITSSVVRGMQLQSQMVFVGVDGE